MKCPFLAYHAEFGDVTTFTSADAVLLHLNLVLVGHLVVCVDGLIFSLEEYWEVRDVHVCGGVRAWGDIACFGPWGQIIVPLWYIVGVVGSEAFRVIGAQEVNLLLLRGLSFRGRVGEGISK